MLWPCLWSFHIFSASVVTFRPKHKGDYIFRLQSNEAWWDPKNSTNSKVQDSWQNSELLSFLPKLLTNSDSEQSLYFVLPGHAESCRWIGSGSVKIPEWATALTIICPPSHCKTRKMTNTWVIVCFIRSPTWFSPKSESQSWWFGPPRESQVTSSHIAMI